MGSRYCLSSMYCFICSWDHAVYSNLRCSMPCSCVVIFDQLVSTETLFTLPYSPSEDQRNHPDVRWLPMSGSSLRWHSQHLRYKGFPVRISATRLSLRCSSAQRPDYRNPRYLQDRHRSQNPDIRNLCFLQAATIFSIVFSISVSSLFTSILQIRGPLICKLPFLLSYDYTCSGTCLYKMSVMDITASVCIQQVSLCLDHSFSL